MMSGVFASLSVGRAWEKLSSFLRVFFSVRSSSSSAAQDDLEELRKLERTMRRIRATLHDAEEHWNIREESAKLRLRELKELAYDAEDVVEEYEVNRHKVDADLEHSDRGNYTSKRKRQEENEACLMDIGVVAVPHELVLRARKITERLNEMEHYSNHFTLSENDGERYFAPNFSSSRHTSSFVYERNILGRDQDRDIIVMRLLSREGNTVRHHVSVMAIVGMGGIGKTTLAQLVYNDTRVSGSFDKKAWVYASEHFDVITITRNIIKSLTKDSCELTELDDLHGKLVDEIKDKRVLLVLDDVWNDKRRDSWESLCTPMSATMFCQIILTTRSEAVAKLVQTMPLYRPSCLSHDESWLLFKQVGFPVDQDSDPPRNLVEIGKSIVEKCKGLPLAIKTTGSMLRYETDEKRWKDVLESELWDLEQAQYEVLPALELSYKHMPIYLKRCFLALSLFPKVRSLDKTQVMRLWKILGLLHGDGNDKYKTALRSDGSDDEYKIGRLYFNELVQRSILVHEHYEDYCLHDLIHDLTCFLAGDEFYRFEADTIIEIPQNARFMSITAGARSVQIPITPHRLRAIIVFGMADISKDIEALFLDCKKLRALHLRHEYDGEIFRNLMGNMKLLRYLSISVSGNTKFSIPVSIKMLGGLPFLEYLTVYSMDSVEDIGREFVRRNAGDKGFPSLTNLGFNCMPEWSEWYGVDDGKFPCLRTLSLYGCHKVWSPPLVPFMSTFTLDGCDNIATIPASPALRNLVIKVCSGLRELPTLPSLLELYIEDCSNLSSIGSNPCESAVSSLPKLTTLKLSRCPNLVTVGWTLPSLTTLYLRRQLNDELMYSLLNDDPSLVSLEMHHVNWISILLQQQSLPSLRKLCLRRCYDLRNCDGLASLTSLEHVEVWWCPRLPIYNIYPRQLKTLVIQDDPYEPEDEENIFFFESDDSESEYEFGDEDKDEYEFGISCQTKFGICPGRMRWHGHRVSNPSRQAPNSTERTNN